MNESIFKHQKNLDEEDFGYILQRMDSIEKFFPTFANMIEEQGDNTQIKNQIIESKMKRDEID